MVVHGLPNTVGVTLEMMILHGQAVMRGAERAHGRRRHAVRLLRRRARERLRQRHAHAEGNRRAGGEGRGRHLSSAHTIAYLVERGIPVMGHVGLRPQAVNVDGKFRAKGRTEEERAQVLAEARAADAAGAFAIVVEGVDETLAPEITAAVKAPTIGIGASAKCDGQILVTDDLLGLFDWTPKFVRRYADLKAVIDKAAAVLCRRCPRPPFSCRSRDLCPGRRKGTAPARCRGRQARLACRRF